jgi:uncharacterized sulfatase
MPHRAHPALISKAGNFKESFTQVAPKVWSAVGFSESNVHIIEGNEGLVVIDTTDSISAAKAVLTQVRGVTQKPVRTVIYTHGYGDHIGGASVFADAQTEILASESFRPEIAPPQAPSNQPTPSAARARRARRILGADLPPREQMSFGFGPANTNAANIGRGYLPPTRTIGTDGAVLDQDGLRLEIHSAPGNTTDNIIVWHPEARTLFCGDIYYDAFPKLASIRGSGTRDFELWARSLDDLITFGAEALAPGHTAPVMGAERVRDVLSDYRDAIRHIILATVEGLNAGRSVEELAHTIALPKALASKPHLQEVHGRVDWAVRAYAQGTLGWFDGNPTNLSPLAPKDEAERMIALAGGPRAVMIAAEEADDPQWAMQLCDRLILAGYNVPEARALKYACLRVLGEGEANAIARNYYLSCALEIDT